MILYYDEDSYKSVYQKMKDDIDDEEYKSSETSINSKKLPAVFSKISLKPGTINLDYGGGKFDNVARAL